MQLPKWIFFIYACAGFVFFVVGIVTKLVALWIVGIALMVFALIRENAWRRSGAPGDHHEGSS
ncbi:hypothetical protein ACFL6Q_06445 [Candidatus Neomarinimicrobiota bacterium]